MRRFALLAMLTLVFQTASQPVSADEQAEQFIRMGTGSSAGTYFAVGGMIAGAISGPEGGIACGYVGNCGVPGLIVTAVTTAGSVDNVLGIIAGRFELAIVQADIAHEAFAGTGPFARVNGSQLIRAVANLYPEQVHVVVRAASGIQNLKQLRGKRVSLGEPASGTTSIADMVLAAYDLSPSVISPVYETIERASDLLVSVDIDALFMVGGYPLAAITHAAETVPLRLLPIAGDDAAVILRGHRFLVADRIPEDAYPDVNAADTVAVGAQLVVSAAMSEDLAYRITRALWDPRNRRILNSGRPNGRAIRLANALDGIDVPMHPGSARYYAEAGLNSDGLF